MPEGQRGSVSETSDAKTPLNPLLRYNSPLKSGGLETLIGGRQSVYSTPWPTYDEWMLVDDEVTIAIQINGKLRGTYTGLNGVMQDEVSVYAHETPEIFKWLENKILVKEIFIPNKMLSIVVKD